MILPSWRKDKTDSGEDKTDSGEFKDESSNVFSSKRKEKWLTRPSTHYGKIAICSGAVTGLAASSSPFVSPGWEWAPAVIGILGSFLTWSFKNADKFKNEEVSKSDFNGLVSAIDKSHGGLLRASEVGPNSPLAKQYVETVIDELRVLLEPEGRDNCVRVCVYRRDTTESVNSDGDPKTEEEFSAQEVEQVDYFVRYVFERGDRIDAPRSRFSTQEEPGATFLKELSLKGTVDCSDVSKIGLLSKDSYYQSEISSRQYRSFVNIALRNEADETFAMLTCDSIYTNFFDERRHRLIRAFIPLIKLALQEGATRVPPPTLPKM